MPLRVVQGFIAQSRKMPVRMVQSFIAQSRKCYLHTNVEVLTGFNAEHKKHMTFTLSTTRNISRGNILLSSQKNGENDSIGTNKTLKYFKYVALAVCGLHFTMWSVQKLVKGSSPTSRSKVKKKEEYEYYVDPYSEDKQGLMNYKGVWLPRFLFSDKLLTRIQSLQLQASDIVLVTYPKSGTTWLQEIIYLLKNSDRLAEANRESLQDVFPFLEFPYNGIDLIESRSSPRLIKTHLPYHLLPASFLKVKPKMIYVTRNVKDVSVSYYHFHRMAANSSYRGTFHDFLENFLIGRVSYGSWWDHLKSYLEKRHDENIYILSYESLHKDFSGEIKKLAQFLGLSVNNDTVEKIKKYCSFSKMKENPATNFSVMEEYGAFKKSSDPNMKLLRKGQVGDWKNYYTDGLAQILDEKTQKELGQYEFTYVDM